MPIQPKDEDTPHVKNNKLLEELRNGEQSKSNVGGVVGDGHAKSGAGVDNKSQGSGSTNVGGSQGTQNANGSSRSTFQGPEPGSRQTDRENVNPSKSGSGNSRKAGSTPLPDPEVEPPRFQMRNPFPRKAKGPVKLFSKQEADDEFERMRDIYLRGSEFLDDILEIIVKDHEPIVIWALTEEEAETLAGMHLERAQHTEEAARSARKLLEIYDRLYMYLLIYPRSRMTIEHIKLHGGLSFK